MKCAETTGICGCMPTNTLLHRKTQGVVEPPGGKYLCPFSIYSFQSALVYHVHCGVCANNTHFKKSGHGSWAFSGLPLERWGLQGHGKDKGPGRSDIQRTHLPCALERVCVCNSDFSCAGDGGGDMSSKSEYLDGSSPMFKKKWQQCIVYYLPLFAPFLIELN